VQDLALGLVELHAVHAYLPLQPVKVRSGQEHEQHCS